MPPPTPNPDFKRIANLLMKYLTDTLDSDEAIELSEWISLSPKNKQLFEKITNGELLNIIDELDQVNIKQEWELFESKHSIKKYRSSRQFKFYIAASSFFILSCVIIIKLNHPKDHPEEMTKISPYNMHSSWPNKVILTLSDGRKIDVDSTNNPIIENNAVIKTVGNEIKYISQSNKPIKEEFNTISTGFGKQSKIILADGSKIWLNAGSSIHYPTSFHNKYRKVNITGEAYFEIASLIDSSLPENKIPFVVEVNGMEINVKGTHFNVNAYNNENAIKTSLLEGSIEIKKGASSCLLQPGQQADLITNGTFKISNNFKEEEVLSWKNGLFVFNNLEIEPIGRQISRWYNVNIVFEDVIMDRFSTTIPRNIPLEHLLQILELSNHAHFRIENNTVIVSK